MVGASLIICLASLVELSIQDYPFNNVSLSWDARVDDLVGRLTLDEITLQLAKGGAGINGPAPAIKRLGIGPYQWDTECLHGDMGENATAYPESIGLAASFSTDLIFRMAEATAVEVRATHNAAVQNGSYVDHTGLSCFAPVINIMRDPRWGRNQETYGEDPIVNGMLASAFVKGLQGDHPRFIRANAGCKHFDVYGGPENIPVDKTRFSANVTLRDLRTTFLPAFRYCVEAGSHSLMCSYNSINGVPACANKFLLTDVLRNEWGFKGYVISDQVAVELIKDSHHYYTNNIDTAAGAINAGLNLELAGVHELREVFMSIPDAIKEGKLTEDLVRERVKPLFYTRMRLGEFDPPEMNPYASITTDVIEEKSHRDLAVEAAMKTLVLLKNDGVLPLKKSEYDSIAVVGPMANNPYLQNGDYAASPDFKFVSTPIDGLQSLANKMNYAAGCRSTRCILYDPFSVKKAVTNVEIVLICVGLGTLVEAEGKDRTDLELPGQQQTLIQDVIHYSGSAKIVLISFNAGPVNITWADMNPRVSAIIAAFYPGQATGVALKNVLINPNQSVFGRLPYTWYYSEHQVPEITNYSMQGRTYRYFKGEPLYPFGYGLTYTKFEYSKLQVPATVQAGDITNISVTVRNTMNIVGDEVVQVYILWLNSSVETPQLQLVNFTRLTLQAYQTITYHFTIKPQNIAVYTDDRGWVVEQGDLNVYVGGEQPNQKKHGGTMVLDGQIHINGTKILGFY
ncbi:hypothetical protein LOTGIDRAFT_154010 [Lottia gigantea]|uniref:Fibronectin type III-like domain-containing protein n=1 Tax=Lottia gigantea TaxID=225164 RepID=V3ZX49_LOTGI|nr:hypothetical protein LOTGIDRAFT_154010 [Lottia gigantea]ESO88942.1 hypothetical protein LOTGIDRAFT_154010 [Lottia gigantea]